MTAIGPTLLVFGGFASIAFAAYLVAAAPRKMSNWLVAGLSTGFGGFVILSHLPAFGLTNPWFLRLTFLEIIIFYSFLLGFLVVYPDPAKSVTKRVLLMLAAAPALIALLATLIDPVALVSTTGAPTNLGMALWTATGSCFHLLSMLVLGHRYLLAPPGPRRRKIFFVLAPFMLEALNDGLFYASPHLVGAAVGNDPPEPARLLGTLAVLSVSLVAAAAWVRPYGNRIRSSHDRWLLPWAFIGLGLSLAQHAAGGLTTHLAVDFIFMALFLYGVARFQTFDIDLKVKWTISRGTIAAAFVAVFLVATEGAQVVFGERNPWVGIGAAAILVFALAPLQRLADRLADAAMPRVHDTAEYRTVRKREVYRATLEEMLVDGVLTARDRRALLRLQETLGLDASAAQRLEIDVLDGPGAR